MTLDVVDLLAEAGDLMERDGSAAVAERAGTIDATRDAEPPGAEHQQRDRRVWLAAAVVLVVALAAAAAVSLGTEEPPALDPADVVALVPSDRGASWGGLEAIDLPTELAGHDIVVLGDAEAFDDPERTVTLTRTPRDHDFPLDTRPVSGSGFDGELHEFGSTWTLRIDLLDTDETLGLGSATAVSVDELFELAAALDLTRPLVDQEPPSGWRVRTTARELDRASTRSIYLERGDAVDPTERERLFVSTISGVGESALWMSGFHVDAEDGEVRGSPAWINRSRGSISLTWMETPDLAVSVTYRHPTTGPDQPTREEALERALAIADDLVGIGLGEWNQLVADTEGPS
jgi:hypothetical protein